LTQSKTPNTGEVVCIVGDHRLVGMSNNRVVLGLDKTKKESVVHLMSVFMSESILRGVEEYGGQRRGVKVV
jgi:hypothetical protein